VCVCVCACVSVHEYGERRDSDPAEIHRENRYRQTERDRGGDEREAERG